MCYEIIALNIEEYENTYDQSKRRESREDWKDQKLIRVKGVFVGNIK